MNLSIPKIDARISDYTETVVRSFFERHQEEKILLVQRTSHLTKYYIFTQYLIDIGALDECHNAERTILANSISDFFGVKALVEAASLGGALTLVRNLLERLINLRYIHKKFPEYADTFYYHAEFEQYLMYERDRANGEVIIDEPLITRITQRYHEIKHLYEKKRSWYQVPLARDLNYQKINGKTRKVTVGDLARYTELSFEYERIYSLLSKVSHGQAVTKNMVIADGNFTSTPVYDSPHISVTCGFALEYFSKTVQSILERIGRNDFNDYSKWLVHEAMIKEYLK
ncbi:hypothetical protein CIG75_03880 [Tumebacillus algifaecis]|uniref:Uncharacterized protein n=1 Tax=Tumebacillus algifaecis TaxID=1214604 RepID=A0A223CXV0_9BACL|nr:DUF5677 domain-containing protein [Tumebacillus algifaecis]ASS74210.1 hypothetical protein CIG75_03880 [Tumebacillus algifaecis]